MPTSNSGRGVKNPIGLKCGPSSLSDELIRLIDILIPRMTGTADADLPLRRPQVFDKLPQLCAPSSAKGASVVWSCDPMHGNTVKAAPASRPGPSI